MTAIRSIPAAMPEWITARHSGGGGMAGGSFPSDTIVLRHSGGPGAIGTQWCAAVRLPLPSERRATKPER